MWGEPKQARSATTSLMYLTVGALMDVWTIVYYVWLRRHDGSEAAFLWSYGFFFSGLVLMGIGLAIGHIGRAARAAEVAPTPPIQAAPPQTPVMSPIAPVVMNGQVAPAVPVAQMPRAPETAMSPVSAPQV